MTVVSGDKMMIKNLYNLSDHVLTVPCFAVNSELIISMMDTSITKALADLLKYKNVILTPTSIPKPLPQCPNAKQVNFKTSTFTLTFGEVVENHAQNQQIGKIASGGYSMDTLRKLDKELTSKGIKTELIMLPPPPEIAEKFKNTEAGILIIRNGINLLFNDPEAHLKMFNEQAVLDKDKKCKMRGRVVNKHARWNLCFDDTAQKANYEEGEGTVVAFNDVPMVEKMRDIIDEFLSPPQSRLKAEGNYYYDINKTYIGFHGDTERRIVIGVRLGAPFPIFYQWYLRHNPIGPRFKFVLNGGDIYIMSDKAVGSDWKSSSFPTLRHAAGFEKVLKIDS